MTRHAICAMCAHFTIAGYPDQAKQGLGRCTAYDNEGTPAVFVPWDGKFTVLYRPAANMAARRAFIHKQQKESHD